MSTERTVTGLVSEAPEIVLSLSVLDQYVSWSATDQKPVTLREYIAARSPQSVREALRITSQENIVSIKRADELTDKELQKLTIERICQEKGDALLYIEGVGYSKEARIKEVEQNTEVGSRLVRAAQMNAELIQKLIDAGKASFSEISTRKKEGKVINLPDFNF